MIEPGAIKLFVLNCLASLIGTFLYNTIANLRSKGKNSRDEAEIRELSKKRVGTFSKFTYSLQTFGFCFLFLLTIFTLYLSFDFSTLTKLGELLDFSHANYFRVSVCFVVLIGFVLLIFKTADVRRHNQMAITLRGEVWKMGLFGETEKVTDGQRDGYLQDIKMLLTKMMNLCVDTQSRLYRIIASIILSFHGIKKIDTTVWLKLPDFKNKVFIAVDLAYEHRDAGHLNNIIRKVHLPFHDPDAVKAWEERMEELNKKLKKNRKDVALNYKILKHKEALQDITSLTGRIFYNNQPGCISNVKYDKQIKINYLGLIERELKKRCKFRSAAGVPIVYNKKILGVLMATSNIQLGVNEYTQHVLSYFSYLMGRLIHWGAPLGFFGTKFENLVDEAPEFK